MKRISSMLPFLLVAALSIAALTISGCNEEPEISGEENTFVVYDFNADQQRYELRESKIKTLGDARVIEGEIAFLRGGGNVVLNHAKPETEEEIRDTISIEGDVEPQIEFSMDSDGVVVAWDFDGLMLLTLYHHLERATEYFDSVGFDVQRVGRMPVYYFPEMSLLGIPLPLFTDNAAYSFTLDAFIIPPRYILDEVPLSANRGVIVHEYSHAVFNRIVYQDRRVPRYMLDAWPEPPIEQLRSLDEGIADIFAALATGDANFISSSISSELFQIDRDLSKNRFYDAALVAEIEKASEEAHNPYILGSVVASTLWDLREHVTDVELADAILAGLESISSPTPTFGIEKFFNALLTALPDAAVAPACTLFTERLVLIADQLNCS